MSFVVGTAGHIDHGKSTLIQALTGIDPDRLEEEKRRGMTIDLGFAYLNLPSGRLVGIVDVPGHARFIRNMLAGVHGLDAVLLVVAADEGVMPQTIEHLEIVDLLEISRGLAVLTKADLVEADWLDLVRTELVDTIGRTSLAGAEVLVVSPVTGQGLDLLKERLDALLEAAPTRPDGGRPRLPIDRVFTMGGFGTVVTGTLIEGSLGVGEEVELQPGHIRGRIRGLQQHNRRVDRAEPGSRVAANLSGVDRAQLRRGHVLSRPGQLAATRRADASVRVLAGAPRGLRHGSQVLVHTGTAEVGARAIVLAGDEIAPGQRGWVQLYLSEPLAIAAGDRFVLRLPSPSMTLGGGSFADVLARRHARLDPRVSESLERRAAGQVLQEDLRRYPLGVTLAALARSTHAEGPELEALEARRAGQWLFAPEAWTDLASRARLELDRYHAAHPLRRGMPREELKSRLGLAAAAFAAVVAALVEEKVLEEREAALALPDHNVRLDPASDPTAARLLELLGSQPFAPPSLGEAQRGSGAAAEVVRALAERGDIVRLSEEVAFTREAFEQATDLVRTIVAEEGSVTVARLRDRMGASRRPVLALLEHLDAQRITRRVGDDRVLR